MGILDQLFRRKSNSAKVARDRLIIALELQRNSSEQQHTFIEQMKKEIVAVVEKYFEIDFNDIELNISKEKNSEILALNINLPDRPRTQPEQQNTNSND